jgi:Zn-finger nucleic acid-binding protein
MVIGYRGDVRFDRCSAHGVWLDAGEYERLRML